VLFRPGPTEVNPEGFLRELPAEIWRECSGPVPVEVTGLRIPNEVALGDQNEQLTYATILRPPSHFLLNPMRTSCRRRREQKEKTQIDLEQCRWNSTGPGWQRGLSYPGGVAKVTKYRAISPVWVRISDRLGAVPYAKCFTYPRTAEWVYHRWRS
jgi:hypothetical protein